MATHLDGANSADQAQHAISVTKSNGELAANQSVAGRENATLAQDIMRLAQLGDDIAISQLLQSGPAKVHERDGQGITALHWAALNNHLSTCRLLVKAGADVNAQGGDLNQTPAMWAARRGYYVVVHYLLKEGADTTVVDVQGFSILHLATFSKSILLMVILLHYDVPVDTPGSNNSTAIMWAANQGHAPGVDLFLRWGASVAARDSKGFSALHYAVYAGNYRCISCLLDYGSDRFAENEDGKTPADLAEESGSWQVWQDALHSAGFSSDGHTTRVGLLSGLGWLKSPPNIQKLLFFWPFATIWVVLTSLAQLPAYYGIPLALLAFALMHWLAISVLRLGPGGTRDLSKTPYLAGIFSGTCFWVFIRWSFVLLPYTYASRPILNLLFLLSTTLCVYLYAISVRRDPGFIPKPGSKSEQKSVVDSLIESWKFDERNFCTTCMNQRPLRSKHCKRCGRCVAKHDHHCPWIYNCVGVRNHRQFFFYVAFMEIGIALLFFISKDYFEILPPPDIVECPAIPKSACELVQKDAFTLYLVAWACLQMIWSTMLIAVQLSQIARGITTFESMSRARHGSTDHDLLLPATVTLTGGLPDGTELDMTTIGPSPAIDQHTSDLGHRRDGATTRCSRLIGLDLFISTARRSVHSKERHSRRQRNPFNRGIIKNCQDFFCDSRPFLKPKEGGIALLGGEQIDYFRLYDLPRQNTRLNASVYHSVSTDDVV